MTAPDLKSELAQRGWGYRHLAEALAAKGWPIHYQTVAKWARGAQPIPGSAEIAIRCVLEHGKRR